MALNTFKCNCLTPLHFKRLTARELNFCEFVTKTTAIAHQFLAMFLAAAVAYV